MILISSSRKLNKPGQPPRSAPETHVFPPPNYQPGDIEMQNGRSRSQVNAPLDSEIGESSPGTDERYSRTYVNVPANPHHYSEEAYAGYRMERPGQAERNSIPSEITGNQGSFDQRQRTQAEPEMPIDPALGESQIGMSWYYRRCIRRTKHP